MNTPQRDQLNEQFTSLMEHLLQESCSAFLAQWSVLELTMLQANIIVLLQRSGPMRMGTIANSLGHTLSSSTSLVDRLVEKGLVIRSTDVNDRRAVVCKLTLQGQQTVQQLYGTTGTIINHIIERCDTEELQSLVQALDILRQRVAENNANAQSATTVCVADH